MKTTLITEKYTKYIKASDGLCLLLVSWLPCVW